MRVNLHLGLATLVLKRKRIEAIDRSWGPGWFDRVPADIRHERWACVEDCSVQLLTEVAANAAAGIRLDRAIDQWTSRVADRSDHGRRRELKIGGPTVSHLLAADVAFVNRAAGRGGRARRKAIPAPPVVDLTITVESSGEDAAGVGVGTGVSTSSSHRPSTLRHTSSARKRKATPATGKAAAATARRAVTEQGGRDESPPTVGESGANKRARRTPARLRRSDAVAEDADHDHDHEPVEAMCTAARAVSETLSQPAAHPTPRASPAPSPLGGNQPSPMPASDADPPSPPRSTSPAIPPTEPSSPSPSPFVRPTESVSHTRTVTLAHGGVSRVPSFCRGPALARAVRGAVKACHELQHATAVSNQCCGDCRPPAHAISRAVLDILAPSLNALQQVEHHRLGGEAAESRRPAPPVTRGPPLVEYDSDDD